ncbi:LysR family transcriptional regulator [Burkholderia stagnalis]|uniref:LysR family transcriptional regulator n=1 Tax=Burkholderia stagnalis TaxID=1503054 RepID=A0ABX9YGV1_9BURK|nr:LysR family transcriptional regulator [Burkholderia stagnalis]RQQ61086.1 LysR family transcriptional regulator [Burkholderia stagnalis]RQQ62170.1 LysR family transcriptional regulator [Burkholderia stagnalis]RQQ76352.1 LysR family transcriptional regulator [Burkholderia stagnalis]RQQ81481.1 LysR family transcriptional regulator [Burkholderia stagnalis]
MGSLVAEGSDRSYGRRVRACCDIFAHDFRRFVANPVTSNLHSHLQGIAAFVHSVETGSFTAAAARMGVSKSVTGKSVARLEARLGVRLLNRTTRSLGMTAEGLAYYDSCRKVLEELSAAETLLASSMRRVSGTVRINLPISFGRLCVVPVLAEIARAQADLDMNISFTDRRVDLVEEGVDLAIRIGDPGDHASLVGRQLCMQRLVICASPDYLRRRGVPASFDALRDHDCLAFGKDGQPLPWPHADAASGAGERPVRPRYTIGHGEALRDAARSGMGLACLATWLAIDDVRDGTLDVVPLGAPVEDVPITALWPRSRTLAPKVRVVVDALVDAFRPVPPWDLNWPAPRA